MNYSFVVSLQYCKGIRRQCGYSAVPERCCTCTRRNIFKESQEIHLNSGPKIKFDFIYIFPKAKGPTTYPCGTTLSGVCCVPISLSCSMLFLHLLNHTFICNYNLDIHHRFYTSENCNYRYSQ